MGYKKLHLMIIVLGALAAVLMSHFAEDDLFTFGLRVVLSIVIFYILGSIIRAYLNAKFPLEVDGDESDESEESDEPDELAIILDSEEVEDTEGEGEETYEGEETDENAESAATAPPEPEIIDINEEYLKQMAEKSRE